MPTNHSTHPAARRGSLRTNLAVRLLRLALTVTAVLAPSAALAAPGGPNCTLDSGQALIDAGELERAVREFTCVIESDPTGVEGYRGRGEAELLLGRFSDAFQTYNRVTASVVPVHPDAAITILAGYAARLAVSPNDVTALMGTAFAYWWDFQYPHAIQTTNRLLAVDPDNLFGTLFRGSSRLLHGAQKNAGAADLERAIAFAPTSPDVRYIVSDAYTYGWPIPERAFAEASLALAGGLDTPRVHALLASALTAFGDPDAAAVHIERHLEMVTTELVSTPALAVGGSLALGLVPGRTYAVPVAVTAGQTISITTSSKDFWDSIGLLIAPDGSLAVGSDDDSAYFAAFDHVAEQSGVYVLHVTSFESLNTGALVVRRS